MDHDGIAFGFFRCSASFPLEKHVLGNLGRERPLPPLLGMWSLDDLGIFREDAELLTRASRAKQTGQTHMVQLVGGTTNHAAATELAALFKEAHRHLKDLKTGPIYYRRTQSYTRYR